jgi:hypothetical protein
MGSSWTKKKVVVLRGIRGGDVSVDGELWAWKGGETSRQRRQPWVAVDGDSAGASVGRGNADGCGMEMVMVVRQGLSFPPPLRRLLVAMSLVN